MPSPLDEIETAMRRAHDNCPCKNLHAPVKSFGCSERPCQHKIAYWLTSGVKPGAFGYPGRVTQHPDCVWVGHAAIDALAAIARRMQLERDGAEYDAGLERANAQQVEKQRDEACALHDKCDARDIELGLCVPPWRQKA